MEISTGMKNVEASCPFTHLLDLDAYSKGMPYQALADILHRAAPGGQVTLEPVAMGINDAGQDGVAAQVNRAPAIRRNHAIRY